jgi:hypothetical protein
MAGPTWVAGEGRPARTAPIFHVLTGVRPTDCEKEGSTLVAVSPRARATSRAGQSGSTEER